MYAQNGDGVVDAFVLASIGESARRFLVKEDSEIT